MEAMAAGRPVICLDLGDPAIQVTDKTGFKIKAETPQQAVKDLAVAMVKLAQDKQLRENMGLAGKQHVSQNYSWQIVGKHLNKLYLEITK